MINHTRTVLLNLPATAYGAPGLSAAVVPGSFVPATSKAILAHRPALGLLDAGDALTRYRAFNCLIPMLHSAALKPWTLRYDSRVTYPTTSTTDALSLAAVLEASLLMGADTAGTRLLSAIKVTEPELAALADVDQHMRVCVLALAYVELYEDANVR